MKRILFPVPCVANARKINKLKRKKKEKDLFILAMLCACRNASAVSERWTILSRLKCKFGE